METLRDIGHEPTLFFGLPPDDVRGPIRPRSADYGQWTWNFTGVFPSLVLHFNKYTPNLPQWDDVLEVHLANEEHQHALCTIASHLDTYITGDLKTVSLGALAASEGTCDGNIISCADVLRTQSEPSESNSVSGGHDGD